MPAKAKSSSAEKGKKKSGAKKELLVDPATVKSGDSNYYIGGWSFLESFTDVTLVTHSVVSAHTAEDRTVTPLPRTNVLMLPLDYSDEDEPAGDAATDTVPAVIEVADQMRIEGVSRKKIRSERINVKSWALPVEAEPVVAAAPPAETTAAASEREEAASTPPTVEAVDDAASGAAAAEEKEEEEETANTLEDVVVDVGANFSPVDVQLRGPVDIIGVLPQMVVKPTLPAVPQTEEEVAAAAVKKGKRHSSAKSAKSSKSSASSQRKSKAVKLTPEQMEELEQKRAEEEALLLKKTEEAIALAAAQEEYLMTFAHPSRWASSTISNVTFTGPVVVRRAHVVFQNCRFAYPHASKAQLTVTQYCTVSCVKCTFDAPARCGVYVLPTAQVDVSKCLFTGVPQAAVAVLAGGESHRLAGVAPAGNSTAAATDCEDGDDLEGGSDAGADGFMHTTPAAAPADEVPSPALAHLMHHARAAHPSSAGVHVDSAKVSVADSRFFFLGNAAVFFGRYALGPAGKGAAAAAAAAPSMAVKGCRFQHMHSTALVIDAHNMLIRGNTVSDCEYYGLDCRGAVCRNVSVQQNGFGVHAAVRIRKSAHAHLLNNQFHSIPVNDNSNANPCMEVTY